MSQTALPPPAALESQRCDPIAQTDSPWQMPREQLIKDDASDLSVTDGAIERCGVELTRW